MSNLLHLPNVIIAGAPRSGTSSLCDYLNEHNDVYVPTVKEPRFFISEELEKVPEEDPVSNYLKEFSSLTLSDFKALYVPFEQKTVRVDASVQYLYHYKTVIPRLLETVGEDIKIIFMLRHPVKRLISNYKYLRFSGKKDLKTELNNTEVRMNSLWNSFWDLEGQSYYAEGIAAFQKAFKSVKIIIQEEFVKDPEAHMKDVYGFLDLPYVAGSYHKVTNKSGAPKNKFIDWLVFQDNFIKRSLRTSINTILGPSLRQKMVLRLRSMSVSPEKLTFDEELLAKLTKQFEHDIAALEQLLGRKLECWKTVKYD